ncbi:MAG: MarR family transcriptional regulator [Desulfurococcales archaeon]|nr:MarR family transcriptional regulator [Desulfurococcales archaeon]
MSEELWMGMTREEYLLLSYILFQIGPEGEAFVDVERAAEALGLDAQRVRELLDSLQRKRLVTVVTPRESSGVPLAKAFEAFRSVQTGPEGISYFRREVRAVYLGFLRSVRDLLSSPANPRRALSRALYYNSRLEQYRSLGIMVLDDIESRRPVELAGFEEALRMLYRASVYLYPVVTLLSRTVEAPWGETITVYIPSQKALKARIRGLEESIEGVESLLEGSRDPAVRRGLSLVLAGLRTDREIVERFRRVLEEIEGVLWGGE